MRFHTILLNVCEKYVEHVNFVCTLPRTQLRISMRSVRYMHPKTGVPANTSAVACVASGEAAAAPGGLEYSDGERYNFELVYAPSEKTVFFVGSSLQDLKHAYSVMRLDAASLRLVSWERGVQEMSRAVPAFKVCSALSYLYRAHSLCNINKLHPLLRRVIIPGDTCLSSPHWPDAENEAPPWVPVSALTATPPRQQQRLQLNEGQTAALQGIQGAVTIVQGPPGTGKSSFILESFLQRIPEDARMLACTATNKAIDSLVAKFESAGVVDILAVGSKV
jgi:hypothetical protein